MTTVCRSTVRRFDGDSSPTWHFAVLPREARGLRFVAWTALSRTTGRYLPRRRAPIVTVAWVPAERIPDESSDAATIEAALANPDHVPLIVPGRRAVAAAFVSDDGAAFPVVGIKGRPMTLVARVEAVEAGSHGQMTFGWELDR